MSRRTSRAGAWWVLAAVLPMTFLAACGERPDDQRTDTIDPNSPARAALTEEALAQLDSGNLAYRTALYEQALRHYSRVTELAPDQATGWFGLYMAHHALGNLGEADAALERAKEVAPGASLMRPSPEDTLGDGGS
jgi:tetratricopeptide (TPR) repeat protein